MLFFWPPVRAEKLRQIRLFPSTMAALTHSLQELNWKKPVGRGTGVPEMQKTLPSNWPRARIQKNDNECNAILHLGQVYCQFINRSIASFIKTTKAIGD